MTKMQCSKIVVFSCVKELNVFGCKRNDKVGKIKIKSKLFFKESL